MVVQHNLTAMNSNRMLGITTKSQAKSTEKLSSGYKINRAADDAAGLSISEKMRKQIRGLTQASSNAQDGISAVQTAEGALNEVQDMLQRMNELAVKAANGTQSEDDRSYFFFFIDPATTEIDRVAETTKFNETYLLKGDQDNEKAYTYSYATATGKAATATMSTTASTKGSKITTMTFKTTASADEQNEVAKLIRDQGINVQYSSKDSATTGKVVNSATVSLNGTDKYTVTNTTGNDYSIKDAKGNEIATFTLENANLGEKDKADAITPGTETFTASKATAGYKDGDTVKYYDKDGNGIPENALSKYFSSTTNAAGTVSSTVKADAPLVYDALGNKIDAAVADISAKQDLTGALTLTLHVGADATSNNQISVNLDAMSAKGLGVNGLKEHLDTIKYCVDKVAKRIPVVAGTGSNCTDTAVYLSQEAEKYGVDGILLVSPYYNKATQKGLYRHFKTVADSVKVPAILYNVPSRTGCNILPETVVKLCKDVENIVGVKEASGNISQIAHLAAIGQGVVDIYSGNDDQIVPILSLGGIGVISVLSNVAPTQTHEICQKFFDGDVAGSRQMQLDAMDLCNALFCEVNPIPVKTALNMMGMGAGAFRMPLCEMDEANAKRLEKALKDYGIL